MVGNKGKNKKNKGKSDNVHKLGNKKHGPPSTNLAMGQELISDSISRSKVSGKKSSPPTSEYNSRMIEQLLMEKVELIYKIALEKLLDLGYGMDAATRAILMNGSIFGGTNILSNILSNALASTTKGQLTDDTIGIKPIFEDVRELARFSMQTLVNMILQDQSNTTKTDAILQLLQSESLAVHESFRDPGDCKDHKSLGNEKGPSDIDIGKMLKEKTTSLQRLNISTSTPSSSSSRGQVALYLSEPQSTHPYFIRSQLSSDAFESDHSLEFMKSFTNCPDGMSFKDWLRTCDEDTKDDISLSLAEQIKKLQIQVKERKEWARKIVTEAAKKFNATGMELKDLRLDRKEIHGLLKQKEELESCNSKLSERENHLKNVNHDLDIVNQVKTILEAKNREYETEIVAFNLSISESEKSLLEAGKNERRALKKSKETEKHIGNLKRLIGEEKEKLAEMARRKEQVNEAIEQAKLRLRQEKEAKKQAYALLLEEKRLNRLEKENSKSRLASVRRELDIKYRQMVDKQKRLELALSQLKARDSSNGSSSSSSSSASSSAVVAALDPQNRRHRSARQCIICRKGEVSVLFLPCAHQVICSDCSEEVYDALEDHCPCCKTPIEKRVKVYGPSS